MPAPSASLRIAVLGAGKIGSAFAFQLARAGGHDVTVIARPGSVRLAQLERDQAIVDVNGARAGVRVTSGLDEDTPYDLLIVTLLAHQTAPLLPALRRSGARCVQFMFNTFQPETLLAAVGPGRSAFGMPFVQATLDADGRLKVTIGAGGQKTIMSDARWVDLFNAAGLPAVLEPNMPLWLRCHAPLCVAFESVSVAGQRRGGGASWNDALTLARGVQATFAVIKSLGYEVYPRSKRRLDASPPWVAAAMLWFMSRIRPFRELLATGEAECRALVDAILSSAPPGTSNLLLSDIAAMKPS
jgi:2-dehydropantoate 2-reductase